MLQRHICSVIICFYLLARNEQMSMWGHGPTYVLMEHSMEEARDYGEMDLQTNSKAG